MSRGPDFDELVGVGLPDAERERLERAHNLLIAAGAPPELPPELRDPVRPPRPDIIPFFPRRRYAAAAVAAAAVAALAFGGGYLFGHTNRGGFEVAKNIRMHGTSITPSALAALQLGTRDGDGNWPMRVKISYLPQLPENGYYTLWLTRNGEPVAPCGTFRAHGDKTTVSFTVAYSLRRFDGWVVTRQLPGHHEPGPVVLTT